MTRSLPAMHTVDHRFRPTLRASWPRLLVVALAALVLGACTGDDADADDVAQLRSEVTALREERSNTIDRIERLEELAAELDAATDELAEATATDDEDGSLDERLRETHDDLERLEGSLAELDQEVDGATGALRDELDSVQSSLRDDLDTAQGSIEQLRGEIDELRTLYTTLRDRLDRLQVGN